jgi:C4-dicarboxylate transporter DctM subunit
MDPSIIGVYAFILLLLMMAFGLPVAFAMAIIGFLGYWVIDSFQHALNMMGFLPWEKVTNYTFTVVPLFVLMGNVAFHSRFGKEVYETGRNWVGHFPGGLAQATVVGNAFFGAATGSTIAAAATMAKIAVPEMRKYKYQDGLAISSVAASGTMASMIPPSIAMALYGMINEQSISKMLIAGIFPGILMAISYLTQIYLRCYLKPEIGPAMPRASWKMRFNSLKGVAGIGIIFLIVMGSIYTGLCTPTEAGSLGAIGAILLGFFLKRLTIRTLAESLLDAAKTIGMIYGIVIGAFIFNGMVAVSRIPDISADFIAGLPIPPLGTLIVILFFFLVLGTFMDGIAMMFLTMPTIYPIVVAMGWDPIWFGILFIHVYEMGMITPPFGLTLFATQAVITDASTKEIMYGRVPFIISDLCVLTLLISFPQIATFLPSLMKF